MYAVIETGGKQYRVEVGTELEVELLDAEPGKTITIERVLLVADGDESTIEQPSYTLRYKAAGEPNDAVVQAYAFSATPLTVFTSAGTLFRQDMYDPARDIEGATELLVRKNRNGPTGYVDLFFYAQWMRFEDMLDPDR